MSKKNVIVSNVSEGHDNPIAELVQVACQFDSDIMLESDNRRINAKSIMGIMAFNPSDGGEIYGLSHFLSGQNRLRIPLKLLKKYNFRRLYILP